MGRRNDTPLTPEQSALAATCYRLAWGLALRSRCADRDEAVSWAMRGLVAAAGSYDPAKSSFPTWARWYIFRYLGLMREQDAGRPRPASLDEAKEEWGVEPAAPTPEPPLAADDARRVLAAIRRRVDPASWAILEMRLAHGAAELDVAARFGVDRTTVSRRVRAALKAIRRLADDAGFQREAGGWTGG